MRLILTLLFYGIYTILDNKEYFSHLSDDFVSEYETTNGLQI